MTTAKTTAKTTATSHPIATDQRDQAHQPAHSAPGASAGQDATTATQDARWRGKVEVSAHAIAAIAAQAAVECYGVVGVTAHRRRPGAVQRLPADALARGVDVHFVADHVVIDVWVILEHNLRVVEIAHNVMIIVKYAVEQALGLHVARVNINVQALRVRE